MRSTLRQRQYAALRKARTITIGIVGTAVTIAGIAMLVLPGPGILMVFAGLAILATEFRAARRLQRRAQRWYQRMRQRHLSKAGPSRVR